MWATRKDSGFTIVELLIVIVIIGILAAIVVVAYNGITDRARDTSRIAKVKEISKAIERYYVDKGYYPQVQDAQGSEGTTCGSTTENWGHCDRNKTLTDALAPYMVIDPTSLSSTAPDAISTNYYYTSSPNNNYQTYGILMYLKGSGGQNDGGYYNSAYEIGSTIGYCMNKYTGSDRNWMWSAGNLVCIGGN
jgi:general secretion pathway protein G